MDGVQLLVSGLANGCVYGLIALGFVLIYKATEAVNFAQGDFMMLGAFVTLGLTNAEYLHLPFWIAAPLAILIMAFFGWIGITWTMRTVTYKERAREYVLAAKALGATNSRIIFKHIIPNTIAIIVTFAPFAVSSGIVALTSLDYLGFGLPPPTPSWGELLQQGWTNLDAWWIGGSVVLAMIITLMAVTFIGEAIREAFDPKMHTTYE